MQEISIGVLIGAFLLMNYLTFCFGSISMIYEKSHFYLTMVLLIVLYFSGLAGVIGNARFKLPIIPFYMIISGKGLFEIYTFIKNT
jgi:hypothetical protein